MTPPPNLTPESYNAYLMTRYLELAIRNEETRADLLQRERELVEMSAAHVQRTSEAQEDMEKAKHRKQTSRYGLSADDVLLDRH